MSFNPTLIPMVIVPMTFLFVLLIILVAKSPKVGAWLVGGLVFLVPLLLWRGATVGVLNQPTALPLIIVPATFLFVLLAVLISKAPKTGAGLIVALVVMGLLGIFFSVSLSHRPVVQRATRVRPAVPPPGASACTGSSGLGNTGPDLVGSGGDPVRCRCLSLSTGGRPGDGLADGEDDPGVG
jgi:hypothetical protein